MASFSTKIRLLDKSLHWIDAELGEPAPAGYEWAKDAITTLTQEATRVRAHLPEMADAFCNQNGEVVIAEGGVSTVRRSWGEAADSSDDNTVAGALAHRERGERKNLLIFHHQKYPEFKKVHPGNTFAHELAHIGDVAYSNSDMNSAGGNMCPPRMGRHSNNNLFRLCFNVEETFRENGTSALISEHIKQAGYKPEKYWAEKFANAVGYYVDQKNTSPLVNHYIRSVFKTDMEWKAADYSALRSRAEFAFMPKCEKVVGEGLASLFSQWKETTQNLEAYAQKPDHTPAEVKRLAMLRENVAEEMRKTNTTYSIRKTIGAHLDALMPNVEAEYDRFRTKSLPYGR